MPKQRGRDEGPTDAERLVPALPLRLLQDRLKKLGKRPLYVGRGRPSGKHGHMVLLFTREDVAQLSAFMRLNDAEMCVVRTAWRYPRGRRVRRGKWLYSLILEPWVADPANDQSARKEYWDQMSKHWACQEIGSTVDLDAIYREECGDDSGNEDT